MRVNAFSAFRAVLHCQSHQLCTTLVLLQDFHFHFAVASCCILCRPSSHSKIFTLKSQWFNIQRLISQSQCLSKVCGFRVLWLHYPSYFIEGRKYGEVTRALQPGKASAFEMTPMLLTAHWPEVVTRANLTAKESGKCSLPVPRGRKMTWQLSAIHLFAFCGQMLFT